SAFLRWRGMIRDLFAGENIYIGVNEYPNPPIMAAVLRPFAELPPVTGAMAWFYAKVLMGALSAGWAFRMGAPLADAGGSPGSTQDSVLRTQPVPAGSSISAGSPTSAGSPAPAGSPTPERTASTEYSVLGTQYSAVPDAAKALAIL